MKKGIKTLTTALLMGIGLLFNSCGLDKASPDDFINAVEHSEALVKKVSAGGVEYTFTIMPPEAMALKGTYDFKKNALDQKAFAQRLGEFAGHLFVRIDQKVVGSNQSVLKYKVSGRPEYEERVMYYQFYAMQDIRMQCGSKTIFPASYNYENNMDISPINSAVVAFKDESDCPEIQVTFDDKVLNNPFIKVSFQRDAIASLPELNIQ